MAYELKSLRLPRLQGVSLRLFTAAIDNDRLRSLLLPRLFRDAGILAFREKVFHEPPTIFPWAFQSEKATFEPSALLDALQSPQTPASEEASIFATSRDYTTAYRDGKKTPLDVAEALLRGIKDTDQGDRPMRVIQAFNPADLQTQAEASAARWKAGKPLGPLDGVPIAIKDEVDQAPYPTTVGTSFLGKTPASRDATVVARLRAQGALLFAKATMHEIGINPDGSNEHHGVARNPYHLDHDTGGSSSGSAAAVGSGLCPIALGADGGGSIRIPAALCGVVGLKPTFGRVSEDGAAPLCWSVAHLGPIGATAEDVALFYAATAGPDPLDPGSLHQPPVSLGAWKAPSIQGWKLGVYRPWFEHASPAIVEACDAALDAYKKAGAEICPIEVPELDSMRVAHAITILAEMSTSMADYPAFRKAFGKTARINLALGRSLTSHDYLKAQRMRTRALRIFQEIFQTVDAIATPATAITAPLIPKGGEAGWSDLSSVTEVMRYAFAGNLTGLPAITFPVGYDPKGLPIAMQLMGRPWEEDRLLRLAREAETFVSRKPPQRHFQPLAG